MYTKEILMSLHPELCRMVIRGDMRQIPKKNAPYVKTPFKVYLYQTLPRWGDWNDSDGHVIAEFTCDAIYYVLTHPDMFAKHPMFYSKSVEETGLTQDQIEKYSAGKDVYGWNVKDLVVYDKPRKISEFASRSSTHEHTEVGLFKLSGLKKAPSNWCYVTQAG